MARIRNVGIGAALAVAAITGSGLVQAFTLEEVLQIDEGFRLFNEETFGGNGRTCTTCHLPDKNYTISPADIPHLTRRQKDLVFARNTPGLENARLVRELTLFNIGPGNANVEFPVGPFRTSMTMAGLDLTVSNFRASFPGPLGPQLGWSGDGAPRDSFHHGNPDPNADGTLRSFANGAIAQHATRSLDRIAGVDFRFATDDELDAIAAFLKWLGRRPVNPVNFELPVNREFNVLQMAFKDARVQEGLAIFTSTKANCNVCHRNGGAHFNLAAFGDGPGTNFNNDTNTDEERVDLSQLTGVNIPEDEGGFDTPAFGPAANGAFNFQPLIEAPRKKSFFHNGAEVEFDRVMEFYFREPFISSPAFAGRPGHCTDIECLETAFGPKPLQRLGAFIRSLSAFYSLRDCERLIAETIERIDLDAPTRLPALHCEFALDDVKSVLGDIKLYPRPFRAVERAMGNLKKRVHRAVHHKEALQRILADLAFLRTQILTTPQLP
jgi:hypothetical protein